MTTILGAGGAIGNELSTILAERREPFRVVSRKAKPVAGAEVVAADLADRDQCIRAVADSKVVHLLVGLNYDLQVWRELWPRIMANTIEACKQAQAALIFFDNVYMYGKVEGLMTEETPYAPCSKKGEIRAAIATTVMNEVKAGNLKAMIARAADFYGPNTQNGVPNTLIFTPLAKGERPSVLLDATLPHSLTFTPDAARGVAMLAERESAWNQIWHLPTAPSPPSGQEFVAMAAKEFGMPPKYRVLSRPILSVVGWFSPIVRESKEMLYQNDSPYLFDSSKFAREFGFAGTPYPEGIGITAASYKGHRKL